MHNKSPIPVKWAGECSSLAWALLVKVRTWKQSELYLCLIFLTNATPTLKKRHTHTDRLWCRPPPPLSFLSPPLPTQACDVTVSDNEVRILLHRSFGMTAAEGSVRRPWLSGALCWLLWDHTRIHSLLPQVLQQCTSKWEIKGWLAHDIQRMTMPQPAYIYCYVPVPETQRQAGCSRNTMLHGGSTDLGGGYTYRKRAVLYVYSIQILVDEGNVRGRGRTAEETDWQQIVDGVLFDCWSINW